MAENQVTETAPEKEDTIDSITKEFNIESSVEQFRQSMPANTEVRTEHEIKPESIPDPLDTEAHKAYMTKIAQGQSSLQTTLDRAIGTISAYEQKAQREALEADIGKAVKTVVELTGLDPELAEVGLELRAQKDPKIKAIWENRTRNPAALERALKVIAKDMSEKYSVRTDPDLMKSQRALKLSQQQSATTKTEEQDDGWSGLSQEEFETKWARSISGGY